MNALDVMEVIAEMAILGQRVLNVYHLFGDQNMDDGDALTDIAEFMEDLYSTVDQLMSPDLAFTSILVRNLTQDEVLGEVDWPTLTNGSAGNSNDLPTQVAGLVTLATNVSRRRGRKFIPGLTEDNLANGLFDGTLMTALEAFGSYLLAAHSMGSGAGWVYRVVHFPLGAGSASTPTEAIVTNVPSTLTRRRIGVGE